MDSLQGHLLIATPTLSDPNFFHTVVLLVQHGEEGALGLVLNRPLATPVSKVWEQVSDSACLIEGNVFQGGPCEGPLMVVHGSGDASDLEVMPGVYFSTNRDAIEKLVESGADPTRFFIGYAGWTAGQLEAELASDSWLTVKADPAHLFDPPEDLWHDLHRQATRKAKAPSWIPPEIMPDDPSMN
ncbi:MAG TPA: YqgE/AlgH family protein [Humisphaera sp.]